MHRILFGKEAVLSASAYHHGDLRQALLDDASGLLERGGPEALSLRELARRAGVSPRAPYRHFDDREALLLALAAEGFAALGQALGAADDAAGTGRELEAQIATYVRFALEAPGRFGLMFGPRRAAPDDALTAAKAAAFAVPRRRIDHLFGTGDDSRARAMGYWSLAHGLAVLFLDGRVRDELEGPDDEIIAQVTRATLRADPPATAGACLSRPAAESA